MYGPQRDYKGKFGREDKSARMYLASGWRTSLLARMRCSRVCPYNATVVEGPFSGSGCGHAVVNMFSSLLSYADFVGEPLPRQGKQSADHLINALVIYVELVHRSTEHVLVPAIRKRPSLNSQMSSEDQWGDL